MMLFIHEMGHILIAKYFRLNVSDITVFPFGFFATIYHLETISSIKLIIIMLGGLLMHVFFYYALIFVLSFDLISLSYYDYLQRINSSILLFNLLPIYPLDGSRCLFAILRLFLSYNKSKLVIYYISWCIIPILFIYANLSLRIMFVFLFYLGLKNYNEFDLEMVEVLYYKEKYFNVKKNHV